MSSGSIIRNAVNDALAGRSYRFDIHGTSTARHWRQTRSSQQAAQTRAKRDQKQPYTVTAPDDFELDDFLKVDRLHSVFRILEREGGHGTGEDGLTYSDFSPPEVYAALRLVRTKILDHDYRPHPTRLVKIPKGSDRYRELQLNRIIDRVIAKALQISLGGYWRRQLPRLGRDVWHVYADIQRVMREQNAFVLDLDDIKNCFPSTPIEPVLECHRRHISQPDLLWLIETIVRGHDGPEHITGLYQGSPYSPVAMELLLHTILDTRLEATFQGFPLMLRYVDNLNIVCRSVREGCEVLQVCKDILTDLGLSLKEEDGPPQDIRDRDYNRTVLGMIPHWRNDQLTFSLTESAFEDLKGGFAKATICRMPSKTAQAVAEGWINTVGPVLTSAVRPSVVDRVIIAARECGFSELRSRHLREVGRQARKRWLAVSNREGVVEHV